MCMLCGFGFFPWIAYSSHHHTHEVIHEETSVQSQGKALEILKERYAKGEVTKDQFIEMKKLIQQ